MAQPPLRSLKSRALQLLAQRDQSRTELRRKLLRHARRAAQAPAGSASDSGDLDGECRADGDDPAQVVGEVDALLDWLEAHRFLSDERFVEARVHAREHRFGNLRIRSELAQRGVKLAAPVQAALAASELERAAAVRARRFAALPQGSAERAAQARFLAGRGFSPDVVHRLFRQLRDSTPPAGT